MSEKEERWRRPGVRVAVLVLAGLALYFLVLFAQMSVHLYRTSREVRAQEARVTQLAQQNERLEQQLEVYLSDEGRLLQVFKNLPYIGQDTNVAVLVAPEDDLEAASPGEAGAAPVDVASLPAWQQWYRVIFTPMGP